MKKELESDQSKYNNVDVGIVREGEKIVLPLVPAPMHEATAIEYLKRKLNSDQQAVNVNEEIDAHPLEGAWALKKVLEQRYGWAESKPREIKTMFGVQKINPHTISLEVDHQKFEQVIWGSFQIPNVEGDLTCRAAQSREGLVFCISGEIRKKDLAEVKSVADSVREYVRQNSLYKGKALLLKTEDGDLDADNPPSFLDLSNVKEEELIFSDDLTTQIKTNIFTPIEHTSACREHNIPLKRGILMEGPYGTGKTLTAYVTAKKAVNNGWTFIYLDRVSGLMEALQFAKKYSPCVIFAEDIDRVMSGERDVSVDDILNTIDGIESKGTEVMTILTTNAVEGIEKAMLRCGRLDAIISYKAPDEKAAQLLVKTYARGLINDGEDLSEVGKELAGQIPATIREAVERAKLYAISRTGSGDFTLLKSSDILESIRGMKRHLSLLENKKEDPSPESVFANGLKKIVEDGFNGNAEKISKIYQGMDRVMGRLGC